MSASWAEHFDLITGLPGRGDTVIGNDVWFGYRATVMPGVRVGHRAIVASGAIVVDDVPDYGIVGGNPASLIRLASARRMSRAGEPSCPAASTSSKERRLNDGTRRWRQVP